jgi:hypothetical protein
MVMTLSVAAGRLGRVDAHLCWAAGRGLDVCGGLIGPAGDRGGRRRRGWPRYEHAWLLRAPHQGSAFAPR